MQNAKFKIFVVILFLILVVEAQAGILTDRLGSAPGREFTATRLFNLLNGIACWFIRFAIIAIAIMIVVYGIMFLTSRGNPQAMATAKKALSWGIVGAVVIFMVFTIIVSVAAFFDIKYPINQIIKC